MKRRINTFSSRLLLLTICIATLQSCGSDADFYIPSEYTEDSSTVDIAFAGYQYIYNNDAVIPEENIWLETAKRGIVMLPNDGIARVYNPETGTLNPLCPDPLCSHLPYSGCPYGNCIFTNSIPMESDGRMYYYIKNEYMTGNIMSKEYIIYSTDLSGQDIKEHYKNDGNYILGLAINEDSLFFIEQIGDIHAIVKKVNLSSGDVTEMPHTINESLFVVSFLVLNDRIYYQLDDGSLCTCDLNFNDNIKLYNVGDSSISGSQRKNCLYWCAKGKIMELDCFTGNVDLIYEAAEGYKIANLFMCDGYLWFQSFPENVSVGMNFVEYSEAVRGNNSLHRMNLDIYDVTEFSLPDNFLIFPNIQLVVNHLLVTMVMQENPDTKMIQGRTYYAYDLTTGEYVVVTNVSGSGRND